MLIEEIIEFEWNLNGPWPPGRSYTPITAYFYDKTKISKENRQVNCLFNLGFKPSLSTKILVSAKTRPWLLIFHFTIFLSHKKFLF